MEELKVFAFIVLAALTFFGVAVVISTPLEDWNCHKRWGKSGLGVDYRLGAGCMLTLKDGTQIPADHYRVVP